MSNPGKECYGILANVFPLGKEGLREVSPGCTNCPDKVSCLREALDTEQGLELKCDILERSQSNGVLSRLKRWSKKKELSRRLSQKKGKHER